MNLMIFAPIGAVLSLTFALFLAYRIKGYSTGTELMAKLSAAIKKSAQVYLKRQYTGVAVFFLAFSVKLPAVSEVMRLVDNDEVIVPPFQSPKVDPIREASCPG